MLRSNNLNIDGQPLASGVLHTSFPGNILVIIAVEDLNDQNGLPSNIGQIPCGGFAVHSGDEDMEFKTQGGGLALFYPVELIATHLKATHLKNATLHGSQSYSCTLLRYQLVAASISTPSGRVCSLW